MYFFYFKGHFSKNNFNTYSYELFCTIKLLSHFCNTVHWKLVQKCFLFKIKVYVGEQLKMSSSHSTSGMNGKWRRLHIHFDKCRRHILFPEWMGNDDVSTFPLTNVVVTFYFRNEWEMTTSPHSLSQMFIYLFIVHIFVVSFQDFSNRVFNKYLMYISHFKRIINQF